MAMARRQGGNAIEAEKAAHRVYARRWAELRERSVKPFVLHRREHPQQWQAWRAYFHAHGLFLLLSLMDNGTDRTVPTEWPHEFEEMDSSQLKDRRLKDD